MHNQIEWIFFDVGSTLVDESKAFRHRIEAVNAVMVGDRLDNDIAPANTS